MITGMTKTSIPQNIVGFTVISNTANRIRGNTIEKIQFSNSTANHNYFIYLLLVIHYLNRHDIEYAGLITCRKLTNSQEIERKIQYNKYSRSRWKLHHANIR